MNDPAFFLVTLSSIVGVVVIGAVIVEIWATMARDRRLNRPAK